MTSLTVLFSLFTTKLRKSSFSPLYAIYLNIHIEYSSRILWKFFLVLILLQNYRRCEDGWRGNSCRKIFICILRRWRSSHAGCWFWSLLVNPFSKGWLCLIWMKMTMNNVSPVCSSSPSLPPTPPSFLCPVPSLLFFFFLFFFLFKVNVMLVKKHVMVEWRRLRRMLGNSGPWWLWNFGQMI